MLFFALSVLAAAGILLSATGFALTRASSAYTQAGADGPDYRRLSRGWYAAWNRVARGAGSKPKTKTRAGNYAIATLCGTFLLLLPVYGPLLGPIISVSLLGAAYAVLSAFGQRKRAQIEPLLKDFTAAMADKSTRYPLRDSFLSAAESCEEPLRSMLLPYTGAIRSGAPFSQTLRLAATDLDNETFAMVAATVDAAAEASARSVGGALYRLSASIRDREQARKEIWSAGRTTRLARHIYTVLPLVVLGFGVLSNPEPWQTPLGVGAIAAVVGIVIGGRQLMVWLERWQMDY